MILIKRVYEETQKTDGFRVLVDRLWPRGLTKEKAEINLWLKDIAPSDDLRNWFGHDPAKWEEFKKKYKAELKNKSELIEQLHSLQKDHAVITLLYGTKDEIHNQAVVLTEVLKK